MTPYTSSTGGAAFTRALPLPEAEIAAAGGVVETAQVDALDEKAAEKHLNAVVERAGGVDIPETPLIEANFATAAPAAGVTPAQFQAKLEQGTLLGRLPTLAEVADTAAFAASDRAGAMTATVLNLSAGSIAD